MTFKEKMLYHQIHPFKLVIDWSTGLYTTFLLWQHNVAGFLIIFLIPSVIITVLLTRFANLEKLKQSAWGRYIEKNMTKSVEAVRFLGQIIMWIAAWYHVPVLVVLGLLVIVGGWMNGILFSDRG